MSRGDRAMDDVREAIMELLVVHQAHDAERPWIKRNPETRRAQAVVVAGPLLLTSAQMVAHATMIEVQRQGRPPRAAARVVHCDPELNLALLSVDPTDFFDGVQPLGLRATPTSGVVSTVRWRRQQFEAAATRVQRFEVREVFHGRVQHAFLLGQTDLGGGGWAEPVVQDGRLIGLASSQDDHTAVVIPSELIASYLAQVRGAEPYRGFGVLRFSWGANLDAGLAAYLGQTGAQRGVVVWRIPAGSTGHGVIRPRDILLELEGHPIDASGYYLHPRLDRIRFPHIAVDGPEVGDAMSARVLREGREVELTFPLRGYPTSLDLVPVRRGEAPPPYAIVGGLVLVELDGDYLRTWGSDWWQDAPIRLVAPYVLGEGMQREGRRRLVLLSQVLPSSWTIGYQDTKDLLVERINGRQIDSIQGVLDAIDAPSDGRHRIEFQPNPIRHELVLDAATLQAATAQVLSDYDIPAPYRLPQDPPPPLAS